MLHSLRTIKAMQKFTIDVYPETKQLSAELHNLYYAAIKWIASEGNGGITRLKNLYDILTKVALGEEIENLSYTKVRKGTKYPALIASACKVLESNSDRPEILCAILSAYRIQDLETGKPTVTGLAKSVENITNATLVHEDYEEELEEFLDFFQRIYTSQDESPIKWFCNPSDANYIRKLADTVQVGSLPLFKAGGSGGSMISTEPESYLYHRVSGSIHSDYLHLLGSEIATLASVTPKLSIPKTGKALEELQETVLEDTICKIGAIPEKAGKVRFIAQLDYHTQVVLKPIHDTIASLLKLNPNDCTFDQSNGVRRLKKYTRKHFSNKFVASYDHSACSDLMPRSCQAQVLRRLFGPRIANYWSFMLGSINFSLPRIQPRNSTEVKMAKVLRKPIRYERGQPMGSYSSFPMMAYFHHILVQWAAYRAGFFQECPNTPGAYVQSHFSRYAVLGDDVIIADERVGDCYQQLCSDLGMKINIAKSHRSANSNDLVGEFAKRLVRQGNDISPLPYRLLDSALNDSDSEAWLLAPTFFEKVEKSPITVTRERANNLVKSLWPIRNTEMMVLIDLPTSVGGIGYQRSDKLSKSVTNDEGISPLLVQHLYKHWKSQRPASKRYLGKRNDSRISEEARKWVSEQHTRLGYIPVVQQEFYEYLNDFIIQKPSETVESYINHRMAILRETRLELDPNQALWSSLIERNEMIKDHNSAWLKAINVSKHYRDRDIYGLVIKQFEEIRSECSETLNVVEYLTGAQVLPMSHHDVDSAFSCFDNAIVRNEF